MDSWPAFLQRARPSRKTKAGLLLALDPGETTGWALFQLKDGRLLEAGETSTTHPADVADLITFSHEHQPLSLLVFEKYKVYGHKMRQHVGSEVVTIQHIGAIKVVADQQGIHCVGQWAGQAKEFATDRKMKRWGIYQPGARHANDAVRHGVYYLLFASPGGPHP